MSLVNMSAPSLLQMSVCGYCGKARPLIKLFSQNKFRRFVRKSSATARTETRPSINDRWQPVIGLEIHAQILAKSKLFSAASPQFGGPVNAQVAFLDCALPGTLPVINKRCVEAGVITALALGCTVNKESTFDRKHYFYADLPAGYQITQQRHALANNGSFVYMLYGDKQEDCVEKMAHITQIQLEQDSGKSLHDEEDGRSLIDLNRAGTGLMEIITAPDFTSGEEAKAFVRELRLVLMALGTCDGKTAEGSLRVDANISVHCPGEPLGVRSEVKNLNSMNSVKKAIDYEICRQIQVLEDGGQVMNETRSFDVDTGETVPMRDKEAKLDYRFLPEPNLPPLRLYTSETAPPSSTPQVLIDDLQQQIPVLPRERRDYIVDTYNISMYRAAVIVNEGLLEYFEQLVVDRDVEKFTTFLLHEFLSPVLARDMDVSECLVPISSVGQLFDWYTNEDLSLINVGKVMSQLLLDPSSDIHQYIEKQDLWQINDEDYLTTVCQQIINEDPKSVRKYQKGNKKSINKLMGKARKMTSDKGNPVKISQILDKLMTDTE